METSARTQKIAIIGAGWAGLAAALTLAKSGAHVTIFERSPHAGGRAARAYEAGNKAPFAIDNGQHVMIGAYSQVLALLVELGVDTDAALLRLPPQWIVPSVMTIQMPAWCAARPQLWQGVFKQLPMALGLLHDAWQHGGFLAAARAALAAVRMTVQRPKDAESVDAWLQRVGWSARHLQALWRPLCAATLNTPSHRASATTFARVVQDGLMAGPKAAAMLVPRLDLSDLLAEPALCQLREYGVNIRLHSAVTGFERTDAGICMNNEPFDQLMIATPPKDAWRLLAPHAAALHADCRRALEALATQATEPISTLHLNVGNIRLKEAVFILPDTVEPALHNAVLIDRSYLDPVQAGWLTIVISSSHAALETPQTLLTQAALTHLQAVLPEYPWANECPSVLIHAKQATFSCLAGIHRPSANTGLLSVWLAGDYVASLESYPATLEGAVRSGTRVAQIMGGSKITPVL